MNTYEFIELLVKSIHDTLCEHMRAQNIEITDENLTKYTKEWIYFSITKFANENLHTKT